MSAFDPASTAAQKKSVAPAEDSAGRDGVAPVAPAFGLGDRLRPLSLRFGPVGPLKKAGWRLAPAALESIHGKARAAAAGSPGIVFTDGRSSTCGPRVSSHPTPASAELPRYSASVYLFAWEPAAG